MNKKQLRYFSIMFWILMMIFIGIDTINTISPNSYKENLTISDIYFLINGEIYEPFIWLFALLGVGFLIMSWLEKEK